MENFAAELLRRTDSKLARAIYTLHQEGGKAANGTVATNGQPYPSLSRSAATNGTTAIPKAFINSLLFAESKSIRTSTLILAAFNIIAALATALGIMYDCYWAAKKNSSYKPKRGFFSTIHPAETFSLVLAISIVIQGVVFAAAQSTGLSALFTRGCALTAQFMLPAIFLVPFVQIAFGAECALRSLRASPFPARGKWDVPVLLGLVALMEIGVWVPTHVAPEKDFCFASLAWFVFDFGMLSVVLLSVTGGLAIAFAIIIFYRLTTVGSIGQCQRIAASRMVYYLVLAVVSLVFIMPWFVSVVIRRPNIISSMMATVVLNLTGLMTGLLQLFLRSNSTTTSFRPRGLPGWTPNPDRGIRLWGPNDLSFSGHRFQPSSGRRSLDKTGSSLSFIGTEKPELDWKPMDNYELSASPIVRSPAVTKPEPTVIPPSRFHSRKDSYSIFPSENLSPTRKNLVGTSTPARLPLPMFSMANSEINPNMFPPTTTTPSKMKDTMPADNIFSITDGPTPLQSIFGGRRHRRDSSMVSSATVQIGLRLSNMLGPQLATSHSKSSSNASDNLPTTLGATLKRSNSPNLRLQTRNLRASPLNPSTYTARNHSPNANHDSASSPTLNKASSDTRMKALPPVPRVASVVKQDSKQALQLSPTVYSPLESKTYSPTVKGSPSKGSPLKAFGTSLVGRPTPSPITSSLTVPISLSPGKPAERASKLDWI